MSMEERRQAAQRHKCELSLPERISKDHLSRLRLSHHDEEEDFERHLIFSITSDSLHKPTSNRANVTCFRCGQIGHKKGECRTWRTKMCNRGKQCPNPSKCPFAHSAAELRMQWTPRYCNMSNNTWSHHCRACDTEEEEGTTMATTVDCVEKPIVANKINAE